MRFLARCLSLLVALPLVLYVWQWSLTAWLERAVADREAAFTAMSPVPELDRDALGVIAEDLDGLRRRAMSFGHFLQTDVLGLGPDRARAYFEPGMASVASGLADLFAHPDLAPLFEGRVRAPTALLEIKDANRLARVCYASASANRERDAGAAGEQLAAAFDLLLLTDLARGHLDLFSLAQSLFDRLRGLSDPETAGTPAFRRALEPALRGLAEDALLVHALYGSRPGRDSARLASTVPRWAPFDRGVLLERALEQLLTSEAGLRARDVPFLETARWGDGLLDLRGTTKGSPLAWIELAGHPIHREAQLARVALALYAARAAQGAWPATLDELGPRFDGPVPRDPCLHEAFGYVAHGGSMLLSAPPVSLGGNLVLDEILWVLRD